MESGHLTLLAYQYVHQPENIAELWCPKFLQGFSTYAWLIKSLAVWFNSISRRLSFPGGQSGSKSLPFIHMVTSTHPDAL